MELRALFSLLLLCAIAVMPASAEKGDSGKQLDEWIDESSHAEKYTDAQPELEKIMDRADRQEIPGRILMNKVREGATKRVDEAVLVAAVAEELERLELAREILRSGGAAFSTEEDYHNALKGISLFLLNGLSEELLRFLVGETRRRDLGAEAALEAGKSLLVFVSIDGLSEQKLMDLADALLASKIPPRSYEAVGSVFMKAIMNRIDADELIGLMTEILRDGGGLIRLEREVSRRMRR